MHGPDQLLLLKLLLVRLLRSGEPADRNRELARLDLGVADHHDERDPVHAGLADLLAHALLAVVDVRPDAGRGEPVRKAGSKLEVPFGHGDHADLRRREPRRELGYLLVRRLLEQGADHPLDRARGRAVEDRREDLLAVQVIVDPEPVRGLDVDLHRRVLDRPALAVDGGKVDLRDPVVDPVREELDQHRGARLAGKAGHPVPVLLEEVARAPEDRDERGLEVLSVRQPMRSCSSKQARASSRSRQRVCMSGMVKARRRFRPITSPRCSCRNE